jgi:hypothetical protein
MPEAAQKSFRELQSYLCSELVVAYPRENRPYALIKDAATGDAENPGGLGAILTQVMLQGEHQVIAYASRKLQKHEKNYTPYLLEMQAAIWGMEHFSMYLPTGPTLHSVHRSQAVRETRSEAHKDFEPIARSNADLRFQNHLQKMK